MKTKLRELRDEDIPELVRISKEKDLSLGNAEPLWLPVLRDPRADQVFVIEEGDKVLGAVIFRRIWEIVLTTNEPRAARAAVKHNDKIRSILARKGIDSVVGWIQSSLVNGRRRRGMDRLMERAGFRRIENKVSYETEVENA